MSSFFFWKSVTLKRFNILLATPGLTILDNPAVFRYIEGMTTNLTETNLSQSAYRSLLSEIAEIYHNVKERAKIELNRLLVEAYWQIVKRIVITEQRNHLRADYGIHLLERLSKDLCKDFGNGFSSRNLRNMRQFYLAFPIWQAPAKLPWTHYQLLSSIRDEQLRETYQIKAIRNHWSSRELNQVLKKEKVKRIRFLKETAPASREKNPEVRDAKLSVLRGKLFTYRVIETKTFDQDQMIVLDCGFSIYRKVQAPDGPMVSGMIIRSVDAGGEYYLTRSEPKPSDLFTFKAKLERVIDGDTILAYIDCGFATWTRQRLRLKDIDAPEIATKAGQRSKKFVEEQLKVCEFIVVKTHAPDKYDRYLADVFYLEGEADPTFVAEEGRFLNQELLDEHLAVSV